MASVAPLIISLAKKYGLDPAAVIAVARGEGGLSYGAVGDGGHAFGPFQMNDAGGVLTGRFGSSAARARYANSPAGLSEALRAMSGVARGLKGEAAIEQIIKRYERPANIPLSIQKAIARLPSSGGRYDQSPSNPGQWDDAWNNVQEGRAANKGGRQRELTALRGALGKGPLALIQALQAAGGTPGTPAGGVVSPVQAIRPPMQPGMGGGGYEGMTELIHDPIGSIFDGVQSNKPYGGHDKHVHAAFTNAQSVLRAIALAKRLGLAVTENPYTDPSIGKHADKSHHYRTFPGMYNGRRLGQAVDVSGNPAAMRRFYQSLAARPKK
jgi:hypothetical protein